MSDPAENWRRAAGTPASEGRARLAAEVARHVPPPSEATGRDARTRPEVLLVMAVMDLAQAVDALAASSREDTLKIREELVQLRGAVAQLR